MSETGGQFSGRQRRRSTSRRVRLADVGAHALITVGGIGTIVAVMGVCLFLVWVVMPLFLSAQVEEDAAFRPEEGLQQALRVGMDEYQTMGWALLPSGDVVSYRLDDGSMRDRLQPFAGRRPVSWSFPVGGEQAAFGFEDGTIQLATIGFQTTFVPDAELTQEQRRTMASASMETVFDLRRGVAGVTPEGQVRLQELTVEVGDPITVATTPVRHVALALRATGPFLVALAEGADGPQLMAIAGEQEEDFLTGDTRLTFPAPVPLLLPERSQDAPAFVVVDGMGQDVFLGWPDGRLARIHCSDLEDAFLAETGVVTRDGARLTALAFTLGSATLVWGDDGGSLAGGFLVPVDDLNGAGIPAARRDPQRTRKAMALTRDMGSFESPLAVLAPSGRSRMVAAGFEDGSIRLFQVTNQRKLLEMEGVGDAAVDLLAVAPKENALLALAGGTLRHWRLEPRYPEAGFTAMFRPVWYEGYREPRHVWQSSSGTDDFEAKLGMMPLIFGTLKATLYSMLFAAPLALLAAIFTSEFLDRRTRAMVKPGIEMMASLPSVVLGFLAALVFAPLVETVLSSIMAALVTMPVMFLLGAYLWQMLPVSRSVRLARWRFAFQFLAIPPGLLAAVWAGPRLETWLFAGDLRAWLAWNPGVPGQEAYASPFGGWVLLALPLCATAAALLVSRLATPRLRNAGTQWSRGRVAQVDLVKFLAGCALALALTVVTAGLLAFAGFDPRGGVMDTYVQRNALVVGFVMGFAIIPIIYTIAEDALSTVPEHLRSASLGAGATQWQTTMRIVVPTAMSGLFSALMIGLGRAVGETMVVLMAAGNTPVMSWNVFEGFRTLSANIAVELPEAVRNSTHYRTLFLAALVLFAMTFIVNTVAEVVRLRFRRKAYQL